MTAPRIGASSTVNEVLSRYPATGAFFIQHGPLFEAQPGQVTLQYQDLTIDEYAARQGLELRALLQSLNAELGTVDVAAAGAQRARRSGRRGSSSTVPPAGPIGYTGAYRELSGFGIESEPVVARQASRGPS
ncbi:MAG: hypothetical protein ACREK6_01620 [Candidatus Rokuibacteriota bacterium]